MIKLNGKEYPHLTQGERNFYYRQAFKLFRNRLEGPYLCNVLAWLLIDDGRYFSMINENTSDIARAFFPEFSLILGDTYSWPSTEEWNQHRADVLAQCIEETNAM